MLENKKTQVQNVHYTRYIMSWIHAGCTYFGEEFEDWLRSEECTEQEINEIVEIALMGRMELEKTAMKYVDRFNNEE